MKCKCCGKVISKNKAIQYKPYVAKLYTVCPDDVTGIVESQLGEGRKVTSATDDEIVKLDNIYNLLVTKATLLGLTV